MRKDEKTQVGLSRGDKLFDAVNYFLLFLMLMIVLLPLLNVLSSSISDGDAVTAGKVWFWPVGFSLEAYKKIFEYSAIWTGYGNTILYTVVGTLYSVAITLLAAYPLSRRDFSWRNVYMCMFVFAMIFSGGLIPTFLTVKSLGLYTNPWVMVILGATSMTNIIISRTFFETNIPNELREAAEIDGCSNTRFFFSIVLPRSTAIIAVMALFFAVTHWNGYFTAMIYVRDKDWQPLQIVMREILMRSEFNAQMLQQGGDTGVLAAQEQRIAEQIKYALIVVASVPVMCIYPFVQKHFVKGVTVGAVKG